MKTCYVLPLLPSFPSATERRRRRRRRFNEENKEVGRDEENMKKDRRRVRASTVLLQKGKKKRVKIELIPARISCCNMFSVARQK